MRVLWKSVVAVAAAGACGVVLSSCTTTVSGTAIPAKPGETVGSALARVKTPLAQLLPDPSRFPPPYDAMVLPPEAVAQAARDLTGVGSGATVNPPRCVPPTPKFGPDTIAMVVGTDDATRTTLTVELTRVTIPLTVRRDQLTECAKATVTDHGAVSSLTSSLQPPPPVDADDAIAVDQTLESHSVGKVQRESLTSLLAQVGDVRVQVTEMVFNGPSRNMIGGGDDFSAALNTLFTDTVLRVRSG